MLDRWGVEFYDFLKPPPALGRGVLEGFGDLHDRAAQNGAQHGTPVLVTVSGFTDPGVNLFFRVSPMKGRGIRTWRRYAYTLVTWLNFLQVFGRSWREATGRGVEAFKDWRLTDVRNDERITAGSFDTDRAALNTFYNWAAGKYGIRNPVAGVPASSGNSGRAGQGLGPGGPRREGIGRSGSRRRQVKWMLRAPFEQWRDVGLCGYGFDGVRRAGWRGPNEDRDAAFVDGLYGTGLRLQEWGSVLDVELPRASAARLSRAWLAAACVKGAREGRWYRIPRAVLRDVEGYADPLEGSRAEAIRRAQRRGSYERLAYRRVVSGYNPRSRLVYLEGGGSLSVDALGPDERRLLFRRTAFGLEPLAVWLSPNGLPKKVEGWEDTFAAANGRVQRVWTEAGGEGLVPLWCRPHMCRHSFALKWYSLLSAVWQPSLDGFTEQDLLDSREMFGDIWYALSLLMGHADPSTTRDVTIRAVHRAASRLPDGVAGWRRGPRRRSTDPCCGREGWADADWCRSSGRRVCGRRPGVNGGDGGRGGRRAAMPSAGWQPPERMLDASGGTAVRFIEQSGTRSRVFDFADVRDAKGRRLVITEGVQRWMASTFATRTANSTRVTRLNSAENIYMVLSWVARFFASQSPPVRGPRDVTVEHLRALWAHAEGRSNVSQRDHLYRLRLLWRHDEELSHLVRAALYGLPLPEVTEIAEVPAYDDTAMQRITTALRHDIRVARDRVRAGRDLLARYRAGHVPCDHPEYRLAGLVDVFDRTGDLPRTPRGCLGEASRTVGGGIAAIAHRLCLTSRELTAFCLLLTALTGENFGTVAAWPAAHYRPDAGIEGGPGVALVEASKPRRGPGREHMVTPVEDVPEDLAVFLADDDPEPRLFRSPLRVYQLLVELTQVARRHGGHDFALAGFRATRASGDGRWTRGANAKNIARWSADHGFPTKEATAQGLEPVEARRLRQTAIERKRRPVAGRAHPVHHERPLSGPQRNRHQPVPHRRR